MKKAPALVLAAFAAMFAFVTAIPGVGFYQSYQRNIAPTSKGGHGPQAAWADGAVKPLPAPAIDIANGGWGWMSPPREIVRLTAAGAIEWAANVSPEDRKFGVERLLASGVTAKEISAGHVDHIPAGLVSPNGAPVLSPAPH